MKRDINYSFNAPAIIKNLIIFNVVFPLIGFFVPHFIDNTFTNYLSYQVIFVGFILVVPGVSMYGYGTWGKFVIKDFMLRKIAWNGNEQVLDIGAGTGP